MVTLGAGEYQYELSGADWGQIPGEWTYKEATAVDVDSEDHVYVFNRGTVPMIVFDSDGHVLDSWGEGVFDVPHGVHIGPEGSVYCIDVGAHKVTKHTPEGELLLDLKAKHPSGLMSGEPFNRPCQVGIDPRNGDIYVADGYSNARVHKFSPDGRHVLSWGESGTDPGYLNVVHDVVVDSEGWVYIADRENHRVQVFDCNGNYEAQWINSSRAACICMGNGPDPLFYVGEYFAGIVPNATGKNLGPRVTILDGKGTVKARLSDESFGDEPGRFYAPHGIAVDSKGDIYVAEVAWSEFGRNLDPPRELRSLQKLIRKDSAT